jgi:hypothetical protein
MAQLYTLSRISEVTARCTAGEVWGGRHAVAGRISPADDAREAAGSVSLKSLEAALGLSICLQDVAIPVYCLGERLFP